MYWLFVVTRLDYTAMIVIGKYKRIDSVGSCQQLRIFHEKQPLKSGCCREKFALKAQVSMSLLQAARLAHVRQQELHLVRKDVAVLQNEVLEPVGLVRQVQQFQVGVL